MFLIINQKIYQENKRCYRILNKIYHKKKYCISYEILFFFQKKILKRNKKQKKISLIEVLCFRIVLFWNMRLNLIRARNDKNQEQSNLNFSKEWQFSYSQPFFYPIVVSTSYWFRFYSLKINKMKLRDLLKNENYVVYIQILMKKNQTNHPSFFYNRIFSCFSEMRLNQFHNYPLKFSGKCMENIVENINLKRNLINHYSNFIYADASEKGKFFYVLFYFPYLYNIYIKNKFSIFLIMYAKIYLTWQTIFLLFTTFMEY